MNNENEIQIPLTLEDPDLLNYYDDLDNRVVWILDEIDTTLFNVVAQIIRWNREDKDIPLRERKPIKLFFNSDGGHLGMAESLISIIEISKTPVYGFALGAICSAASMIYLACHKKYALPNSYFLLHQGSCEDVSGNYETVQSMMRDYEMRVNKLEQFYVTHSKITAEEVRENFHSDWYLRGEQLIEKGLVDEWITDINILI